jgi:hypothetical protein
MTLKAIFVPSELTLDAPQIWRNNALLAGGTILTTSILSEAAERIAVVAMGNEAIALNTIGLSTAAAVWLGAWYLEHKLAYIDSSSVQIGKFAGLVTACGLIHFCPYQKAMAFGALVAACGAGRLALEPKKDRSE